MLRSIDAVIRVMNVRVMNVRVIFELFFSQSGMIETADIFNYIKKEELVL